MQPTWKWTFGAKKLTKFSARGLRNCSAHTCSQLRSKNKKSNVLTRVFIRVLCIHAANVKTEPSEQTVIIPKINFSFLFFFFSFYCKLLCVLPTQAHARVGVCGFQERLRRDTAGIDRGQKGAAHHSSSKRDESYLSGRDDGAIRVHAALKLPRHDPLPFS